MEITKSEKLLKKKREKKIVGDFFLIWCHLPEVETKYYNVKIDGKFFFDQPVKNDKITYENIRKITTAQGDDYTTGCLLY